MTRYYHKSVISSPIFGLPLRVQWIPIGNGDGIAEESRDDMNAAMQAKIKAGVGGLSELSEEQFLEKKKLLAIPRKFVTEDPRRVTPRIMNVRVAGFGKSSNRADQAAASPAGKSDSSASSGSASSQPPGVVKASEPEVGRIAPLTNLSDEP